MEGSHSGSKGPHGWVLADGLDFCFVTSRIETWCFFFFEGIVIFC